MFDNEFKARVHAHDNGFQTQWPDSGLREKIYLANVFTGCRLLQLKGGKTEKVQVSYDDDGTAAPLPGVLRSVDVGSSTSKVVLVLDPTDYRDDSATSHKYTDEFWRLIGDMQNSFWPLDWIRLVTLDDAKRALGVRDEIVMMTPAQVGVVDGMVNSMVIRDSFKTTRRYGKIPLEPDAEIDSWKKTWKTGIRGKGAERTTFLMTQALNRSRDLPTEQSGPSLCSDETYRAVWLVCAKSTRAQVILDFARQSAFAP